MGVLRHQPRTAIDPTADDTEAVNDILALEETVEVEDTPNEATESEPETNELIESDLPTIITQSVQQPLGRINLFRVRRTLRTRTPAIPVDTIIPPSRSNRRGSKKLRRYENQIQLIRDCDENDFGEVSIDDFLPSGRATRTFTRLLQDADKELWNNFLNPVEDNCATSSVVGCSSSCGGSTRTRTGKTFIHDPEEAFNGVCRKLRNLLKKRHFPLGVVEMLEDTVLEFFASHPNATFESSPLDAFRRGILHALSQYNNLRSHSVKSRDHDRHKQVLVQNNNFEFSPPSVRLVHYLEQKYHSRDSI